MNDLISKLIIDENIQDIPILHICRVAIEVIKLLEECLVGIPLFY